MPGIGQKSNRVAVPTDRKARGRAEAKGVHRSARQRQAEAPVNQIGTGFSQTTFDSHAALLGDKRLTLPQNARQRATIVRRLQQDYGNRYVLRLVDHIARQRDDAPEAKGAAPPTRRPRLREDDPSEKSVKVLQRAWTDNKDDTYTWDKLIDGVRWHADKDADMWYEIIDEKAIKLGSVEEYEQCQGESNKAGWDKWNSASVLPAPEWLQLGPENVAQYVANKLKGLVGNVGGLAGSLKAGTVYEAISSLPSRQDQALDRFGACLMLYHNADAITGIIDPYPLELRLGLLETLDKLLSAKLRCVQVIATQDFKSMAGDPKLLRQSLTQGYISTSNVWWPSLS